MGAIALISDFPGSATPPTGFVTMSGHADMVEGGGVAKCTNYSATCSMMYNTITSTPDDRMMFTLGGSVQNNFAAVFRADATTDHDEAGMVYFSLGTSVAPAWNLPDTIEFRKYSGGTPTTITPTNTANGVPNDFPSIVGNVISLRDKRLTAGDKIEVMWADAQVIVRINDVPYGHEEFTGGRDATGYHGIITFAGSSTDQSYDTYKGGSLIARYVDKNTGNNSNSGLLGSPFLTVSKGLQAQAIGELTFVTGAFTESLRVWNITSPAPRTPTTFEDPLFVLAKAGTTFSNTHNNPWDVSTQHPYTILYNAYLDNSNTTTSEGSLTHTVMWRNGTKPHMLIGGAVEGAKGTGVFISAGAVGFEDHTGGNLVMDVRVQGNGRWDFHYHNFYIQTRINKVKFCFISGASSGRGLTQGYGIHCFWDGAVGFTFTSGCEFLFNVVCDHSNTGDSVAGILMADGTDIISRGNRVHNNPIGIAANFGVIDPVIETNVIFGNSSHGVHLGNSGVGCTGAKVRHNTITGNGGWGLLGGSANATTSAKNNIIWNNTLGEVSGTGITESNNFKTDPKFLDAGNNDYHLNPATTTADTGAPDISGEMIAWIDILGYPKDSSISYGAYEIPIPASTPTVNAPATKEIIVGVPSAIGVTATGNGNEVVAFWADTTGSLEFVAPTPVGTAIVEGGV